MIRKKAEGVLLYLKQEGRGIGLENKLKAYQLQDEGMDTVEANLALGFEADYRKYDIAAEMLKHLGIKSVNLISNNINKVNGISENGIDVSKRVPIVINSPIRDRNDLFRTKQKKLGHIFDKLDDISVIEEAESEKYPLSSPNLFIKNTPVPKISQENTENVKNDLIEKFGDNLTRLLFQGSNMRGDGSLHESDFDYICFFKKITPNIINSFSQIKNEFPRNNFLYLSENEYKSYPKDSRLQFFITRQVYGNFDIGKPPSRKDVLDTAIKYAIGLKDTVRPLLFELLNDPHNKSLLSQAYTTLKRVDDCFMRIVCLYITGKYPLHREHLKEIANGESVNTVTKTVDNWYSGDVSVREVCESLRISDRLMRIFLRMSQLNKI